ncbi:hypothetical protein BDF19DRAFT_138020 [Syncephalis fuscata]|nr:hypothetical protein BDF19DRAFT_138020 [Syncephalis fuscata]
MDEPTIAITMATTTTTAAATTAAATIPLPHSSSTCWQRGSTMQLSSSTGLLPPTPLPVHRSTSISALSDADNSNYPSSRSRSSSIASVPVIAGTLNFAPSSAIAQAHHLIDGHDSPLAAHTAQLAARCDELEWIQQSMQRENDRWRQEVDTLREERIRIEQELREAEMRLALLRPVTPIGIDQDSMPLSPIRCAQLSSMEEQAEKEFATDDVTDDEDEHDDQHHQSDYTTNYSLNNTGIAHTTSYDARLNSTISKPAPQHRQEFGNQHTLNDLTTFTSTGMPNTLGAFTQPDEPQTSQTLIEQLRSELQRTSEKLVVETRRRGELENAKASIEAQLEDLSRTVFEEAQKMVVDERRARAEAERKRDSYFARVQELQDVEQMLKAQLNDLKRMMEKAMSTVSATEQQQQQQSNGDQNNTAIASTTDSNSGTTDVATQKPSLTVARHAAHGSIASLGSLPSTDSAYGSDINSPTVTSFIDPVAALLAFELKGRRYTDFEEFYRLCLREANVLNIGYSNGIPNKTLVETASLAVEPVTTGNSKFLRRCQNDDVEPCVRFDRAGYFLQRKIHTGVQSGTLILEPVALSDARQLFAYQTMLTSPGSTFQPPCTLCECPCPPESSHRLFLEGERDATTRQNDTTSQSQRLICADCRLRLVSACEFWAYVRLMRRGLIRAKPEQIYHDILRHRMRMFLARVGVQGAATLPVHGAHTVAQPVGANNTSAGHSSLAGSIIDGCSKRKSAPDLSRNVLATTTENGITTIDNSSTTSLPSSPRTSPTKLVGGGRNPELAENGPNNQRNVWRSSMVDAMAGARRSWATLSQMSF